jgi:hypothetical protein
MTKANERKTKEKKRLKSHVEDNSLVQIEDMVVELLHCSIWFPFIFEVDYSRQCTL